MPSNYGARRTDVLDIEQIDPTMLERADLEQEVRQLRAALAAMQNGINIDPVTSFLTPAAFADRASAEFQRCILHEKELALVVISVLDQDKIVDEHGPDAWDNYINSVAKTALTASRHNADIMGRVSRNQFALLLPEANMNICHQFKQRLKEQLDALIVDWNGQNLSSDMRLSAGILLEHDTSFRDLYLRTVKQQIDAIETAKSAA